MAAFLKFPSGTRASLTTLAGANGLVPFSLYWLTDELRFVMARSVSAITDQPRLGGTNSWTGVQTFVDATLTGKLTTAASIAGAAGLVIPHGLAPTAPNNGDVWTTTSGMYARINGATVGPFTANVDTSEWTTLKLAADFTAPNSTTFTDITDGTTILRFTPPANSDWEMLGSILIWTTAAANLPRVGMNIAASATGGYGAGNLWQAGATATASVHANGTWNNNGAAVNIQLAAGGVLTASTPWLCEITASGRSGAAPGLITIQLACETAAANTCLAKRGSFIRYRTV